MHFPQKHACPKFQKMSLRMMAPALFILMLVAASASMAAQYLGSLPHSLAGTWRISRMRPPPTPAGPPSRPRPLLGTTITYRSDLLRWHGGQIEVTDVSCAKPPTKSSARKILAPISPANFAQLGIHAKHVTEVDMQHDASDVLPASTAVPGDSVLLAGPNRIIVSACGVYFEATRAASAESTNFAAPSK